jgi:nicotinamide riboside transporter PnuC
MNGSEILGFVTGAPPVLLAVRESAWNWPVGVANSLFFLIILFCRAKLYADSALQIVYIVISIFGWWKWVCGGAGRTELPIARTASRTAIQLIVLTVASAALLSLLLHRFTDSSARETADAKADLASRLGGRKPSHRTHRLANVESTICLIFGNFRSTLADPNHRPCVVNWAIAL